MVFIRRYVADLSSHLAPLTAPDTRRYFAKRFKSIIAREIAKRKKEMAEQKESGGRSLRQRLSDSLTFAARSSPVAAATNQLQELVEGERRPQKHSGVFSKKPFNKLRTDMIRRLDILPKPVNPSGSIEKQLAHDQDAQQRYVKAQIRSMRSKF